MGQQARLVLEAQWAAVRWEAVSGAEWVAAWVAVWVAASGRELGGPWALSLAEPWSRNLCQQSYSNSLSAPATTSSR